MLLISSLANCESLIDNPFKIQHPENWAYIFAACNSPMGICAIIGIVNYFQYKNSNYNIFKNKAFRYLYWTLMAISMMSVVSLFIIY